MTGADFLLQVLRDQGLSHVFLVPGGHIDPVVAELGKGAGPTPIVAAHEEGAGFMADGYLVKEIELQGFVQLAVVISYYRMIAGLAIGF